MLSSANVNQYQFQCYCHTQDIGGDLENLFKASYPNAPHEWARRRNEDVAISNTALLFEVYIQQENGNWFDHP